MTHAPLLDIEALLQPIAGDAPTGPSLRYEPIFDELRELRREDDALAPRGVWRSKLKVADWPAVIARAQATLATGSKDLQIAAWLTEALAARHGAVGAAAGIALLAGLVDRFWATLWPEPGEDAEEDARLTVLEWLDGKLAERLLLLPLVTVGDAPVSWHEQASLQRRRAGAQSKPVPEDKERGVALAKAIAATPTATWQDMLDGVRRPADALADLLAALRRTDSATPPAFAQLRGTLATMEAFLHAELSGRGVNPHLVAAPAATPATTPVVRIPAAPAIEAAPSPRGPIASREVAYRQLEDVARYLEAIEPHSPVPPLLWRAIGWGQMRLPELLAELLREEGGPLRLLRITPTARAE